MVEVGSDGGGTTADAHSSYDRVTLSYGMGEGYKRRKGTRRRPHRMPSSILGRSLGKPRSRTIGLFALFAPFRDSLGCFLRSTSHPASAPRGLDTGKGVSCQCPRVERSERPLGELLDELLLTRANVVTSVAAKLDEKS